MHGSSCVNFSDFKTWLSKNDSHKPISNVEEMCLDPYKPADLCDRAKQEVQREIANAIAAGKEARSAARERDCDAGRKTPRQPNWKKLQNERFPGGVWTASSHNT